MVGLLGLILFPVSISSLRAQQGDSSSNSTNTAPSGTKEEQLAAFKLEMTNAYQRVLQIVNQPVKAYARPEDTPVSVYSPGWFHPGASKPDFNTVDIRKTQELTYAKSRFATSDLNPGIVYLGQDLEFNSMTKYFYTNRTIPKHKLTEAEMLEINQLYRVIGRCEDGIRRLYAPPAENAVQSTASDGETEVVVPGQSFEAIRRIPKQTRVLYGGIAIGVLVLLLIVRRLLRRKSA